jgi:hypothetical protein
MPMSRAAWSMIAPASLSEPPPGRLNEMVPATCALVVDLRRGVAVGVGHHRRKRHHRFGRGAVRAAAGIAALAVGNAVGELVGFGVRIQRVRVAARALRAAHGHGLASPTDSAAGHPRLLGAARIARRRAEENLAQGLRILPIFRRHFHHHEVLVERVVDRRNGPLAKCVIEHIVDLVRLEAIARRGGAADLEIRLQTVLLQIRVDVE